MLPKKRWPPTSTLEPKADMISQRWTLKRYEPRAEEWQVSYVEIILKSPA